MVFRGLCGARDVGDLNFGSSNEIKCLRLLALKFGGLWFQACGNR